MTEFRYSQTSLNRLNTCHNDLITICKKAILISPVDISIVCGHRDKKAQARAFRDGFSKLRWPQSNHNQWPSRAVDLAPYRDGEIRWSNIEGLHLIAGLILGIADTLNIKIRWGGAWKGVLNPPDAFNDLYHFEKIV